jgi:hypothetical protein
MACAAEQPVVGNRALTKFKAKIVAAPIIYDGELRARTSCQLNLLILAKAGPAVADTGQAPQVQWNTDL